MVPKWIDLPVMQVIDYFANTGVYFISIARTIGTILGLIAIIWTCLKIAFGFMETQKGVIGMIAKMLFFIFPFCDFFFVFVIVVVEVEISTDIFSVRFVVKIDDSTIGIEFTLG